MNAAALSKFRATVQKTMEAMFPCTITIGSSITQIPAATGGLRTGTGLILGGQLPDDSIIFRARLALFSPRPKNGDRIIWVERSLAFRVQKVSDNGASDPSILITCQSIAK